MERALDESPRTAPARATTGARPRRAARCRCPPGTCRDVTQEVVVGRHRSRQSCRRTSPGRQRATRRSRAGSGRAPRAPAAYCCSSDVVRACRSFRRCTGHRDSLPIAGRGQCDRCHTWAACRGRAQACATRAATSGSCPTRAAPSSRCASAPAPTRAYPRYPRLPVVECPGYEPRAAGAGGRRVSRARSWSSWRRCSPSRAARRSWSRTATATTHGRSAAASDRWTALRPAQLEPHRGRGRARRALRLRGGRLRAARRGATTAAVERYDIARDRWRRVRSMPVGLNHPAAAAYRGRVYVRRRLHGPRRPARRGGLAAIATTRAATAGRGCRTRPPSAPRWRSASIGGKLYAAGGANRRAERSRRSRSTTSRAGAGRAARTWPSAREHLAGAVAGGAFYVLAGRVDGTGQLQGRRALRAARAPLGAAARHAQAARRDRRGRGRRARDRGRRRGGRRDDRRGRGLRPRDARAGAACRDMRTPRHGLGVVSRGRRVYAIEGGPTPGFDFSNAIEALDRCGAVAERS